MVLGIPAADRGLVLLLQHEPSLAAIVGIGPDDRVSAVEALAAQDELDLALAKADAGGRLAWLGLPGSPVPDDDVSPAVLLRRDDALEVEVLDRVVLGAHRQAADLRVEGRPLRDGPADEDAVDLEAEVVVQRRRAMPLNGEAAAALDDLVRGRLGSPPEVALAPIFLQWHRPSPAARARRGCRSRSPRRRPAARHRQPPPRRLTAIGRIPAASAARMSQVESPTYHVAAGRTPRRSAASRSRSGAGFARSTALPSMTRG